MAEKCRKCAKEATHKVQNYFVVSMRAKNSGPHMCFCDEHAKSWNDLHPTGQKALPLTENKK